MTFENVKITTLPNGLKIVSDPLPHVKTATVGIWNGAGTRCESKDNNGAAHALEHVEGCGTTTRNARQILREIENLGAHTNAYTSYEDTVYFTEGKGDTILQAFSVLSDTHLNPTFPENDVKTELKTILQEIDMSEDDPDWLAEQGAQAMAFGDHPLGASILGTKDFINRVTPEILNDFRHSFYRCNNMVIAASGAIDHDALVDQIARDYGALQPKPAPLLQPAIYQGGCNLRRKQIEQVHLALVFEGVSYHDDDYYAMQALSVIIGGGMMSRLWDALRTERGLVYSVDSAAEHYADCGLLTLTCGASPKEMQEVIPILCDVVVRASGSFSEEEILRAQEQLLTQLYQDHETPYDRAEKIADDLLRCGAVEPIETAEQKIRAIDNNALDRLARRVFTSKPSFAAVGPVKNIESYHSICARLTN